MASLYEPGEPRFGCDHWIWWIRYPIDNIRRTMRNRRYRPYNHEKDGL